jgi:hypothetical protein
MYRFYILDPDAHIPAPPTIDDCRDDQAAAQKAKRHLDGKAIEVWNLDRLVIRLEPASSSRPSI